MTRFRALLSVGESLRSRAIQGGVAVVLGELYSSGVRLIGNLVMTRLLFPEAFGLMLVVNLLFFALAMLSNVGIRDSIISRQEGLSDSFLDTAWTMMIVRGAVLFILSVSLAYPIASYYGQPELVGLILIASLAPLFAGLASPHSILFEKAVRIRRVVIWDASAMTVSLMLTITWLLIHPTIWALAANGVFAAVYKLFTSYIVFPGRRPRLRWDPDAAGEMFRFGRWILIASALSFLARQGDSLIVSIWVTVEQLGVFSIAIALARLLETVVGKLNQSVLFPVYAALRSHGAGRIQAKQEKVKLAVFGLCLPVIFLFSMFGRDIIAVLYDPRYHGAGWMLELLAAGSVFYAAGAAVRPIPLSFGDSFRHMWQQVILFSSLLVCMTIGGLVAGLLGLILGIVAAQVVDYIVLRIVVLKYGIRDVRLDIVFLVTALVPILMVWKLRGWPGSLVG